MKSLLIKAAKDAGKILMKNYGKIRFVKTKEKESYFTNVDLESEKLIISRIRKKYPEHNIISEECGNLNISSDYTWYIDPLDGTHNYISNFPLFGVSIGMAYKGELKIGVINMPCLKELYFAEKGKGSILNGKKIMVSTKKELNKSFIVIDLAFRYSPIEKMKILKKLKGRVYDIRVLGCAVYSYAMVAKGSADGYITSNTNSWDAAAGALIVEEANGKVTNFNGHKWTSKSRKFVTTNKRIHRKLLNLIK